MKVGELQGWLAASKHEREPETVKCERVIELVQTTFRDRTLMARFIWQIVVLLPKGNDDYME